MKIMKYLLILIIPFIMIPISGVNAEVVSDYKYKLDNGIRVNTVHGWNFVWVKQTMDSLKTENKSGLKMYFYDVGDLLSGESEEVVISSSGDTVYTVVESKHFYELEPDNYKVLCTLTLQDKNGYISFCISDIKVQEKMKTTCKVAINDVQLDIKRETDKNEGLGTYRTISKVSKGDEERGPEAYPSIYKPGDHSKRLSPDESINDVTHLIKPGKYDIFVDVDISWAGYKYQVWLENVEIEKDVRKVFTLNLNGSEITVKCTDECPDMIHFYPRGSAEKLGLKEDKTLERYSLEGPKGENICPAGTYDILLNYGYGEWYEWKKDVECKYGELTVIKVELI